MLIPSKDAKSYGAIHIDNYLSFIGFCKKVNSEDIQTIDVYLDNKRIDSIQADKNIEKIEKLYNVKNHAFEFELPEEYIGKIHLLQFKCREEELVNSPIKTISKDNPKFNEYRFLHSLEKVNPEEVKDLYCPNSIGFLATEENLNDESFVSYINQIMKDFPAYTFKALYFNKNLIKNITEKFKNNNLLLLELPHSKILFKNIEVYLSNYEKTYNDFIENKIVQKLRKCSDILPIGLGLKFEKISLKEYEKKYSSYFQKFFDNLNFLGFDEKDIKKYGNSFYEVYFKKLSEKYNVNIDFDLKDNISKVHVYYTLTIGLQNHDFFKYSINFSKNMIRLQNE